MRKNQFPRPLKLTKQWLLLVLVCAGCLGPKTDAPDVNPNTVIDGALIVITVDDDDDRPKYPKLAATLSDMDYHEALEKRGHKFYVRDVSQAEKYKDDYRKVGVPCILLWDRSSKKLLGAEKLATSASTDDIDKIVRRYSKL